MKRSLSESVLIQNSGKNMENKYSMMVKNAGWDIHSHIHRHSYAEKLLSRKFTVEDYGMYIIQLFHIYDTMEILMEETTDPIVSRFWKKFGSRLKRTDLLVLDLEYYYGNKWKSKLDTNKLYATDYYTKRLIEVYNKSPYLLLAHAYIRYFGDLSGGKIVRKRFLCNNNLQEGMYFYQFRTDVKQLKSDYRKFVDELGLLFSQKERELFLREVKEGYLLNYSLFTDLFISNSDDIDKYKNTDTDTTLLQVVQTNSPVFGMMMFVLVCCFMYPLSM